MIMKKIESKTDIKNWNCVLKTWNVIWIILCPGWITWLSRIWWVEFLVWLIYFTYINIGPWNHRARKHCIEIKDSNTICIEIKDGNRTYYSEPHAAWRIWWMPIWFMSNIYNKYWFEFDEKETHKQDVLLECDRRIEKITYGLEHGWFFKKIILKWELSLMQKERDSVQKWYEPQYREVNWHRITVWDTVDVYFDPNNPENYRVDIDFLFKK